MNDQEGQSPAPDEDFLKQLGEEQRQAELERGVDEATVNDLFPPFDANSELAQSINRHPAGGNVPPRAPDPDDDPELHPGLRLISNDPPVSRKIGKDYIATAKDRMPEARDELDQARQRTQENDPATIRNQQLKDAAQRRNDEINGTRTA